MIEIAIGAPNPRLIIVQYGNTEFCSRANRNFYRGVLKPGMAKT
jgi:hypothetical protein